MALTHEQREAFETQGYVNLGPVFDPKELDEIAREYDRLVNFEAQTLGNEQDGVFPYRAMLNFRSPRLAACILEPALLEIAAQLLGDDVRFWWDQGINKAPGSGSPIAWHQDNGYQKGRTAAFLTFWLALDDSDLANGGLQVLPHSSADGLLPHEWRGVHAVIPDDAIAVDRAIPLDARAGDVLLFSSLLVHQTAGNHTADRQRRAWVIQYCPGDMRNEDTGEVYDNRPWAIRDGKFASQLEAERPFDLHLDRA